MNIIIPNVNPYKGLQLSESNRAFVEIAIGTNKFHFLSGEGIAHPQYPSHSYDAMDSNQARRAPVSKLLLAAHDAFALHVPFVLSPETLWYMVVHEVAVLVKSNPDRYRHIFSSSSEKQLITVRDDSLIYGQVNNWDLIIPRFVDVLNDSMDAETISLFIPQFSTLNNISIAALCVAFMDTVSQYYDFRLHTLCGIPEIVLKGTSDDWKLFKQNVVALRDLFPELREYFLDMVPVLDKIIESFGEQGPDTEFWSNMYKLDDHSGGPSVTGWLNVFLAYLHHWNNGYQIKERFDWQNSSCTTDQFPAHFSSVPFIWEYYDEKIPMKFGAGITGVTWENNALNPQLGFVVAETLSNKK